MMFPATNCLRGCFYVLIQGENGGVFFSLFNTQAYNIFGTDRQTYIHTEIKFHVNNYMPHTDAKVIVQYLPSTPKFSCCSKQTEQYTFISLSLPITSLPLFLHLLAFHPCSIVYVVCGINSLNNIRVGHLRITDVRGVEFGLKQGQIGTKCDKSGTF